MPGPTLRTPLVLTALILLVAAASSLSAQERRLDLGGPASLERTVTPGARITIVLTNIVPRMASTYSVNVRHEAIPVDILPFDFDGAAAPLIADPCEEPREELHARLDTASDEASVKRIIGAEAARPSWAECSESLGRLIRQQTTVVLEDTFAIRAGQRLVVEVTRPGETRPAQWRFVFTTEPRGAWRTGYGFTFVPRLYPQYHTEQLEEDPTKFAIRKDGSAELGDYLTNYDFMPSILFSWLPSEARYRNWSGGLTAGLGYNLDKIALFGGLSGTFNENVTLSAGLTVHEQPRLATQFRRNQIVSEDLDSEVLHENRFGPSVFFGISFRFGRNPFTGGDDADETGGEAGGGAASEARPQPGSEAPQSKTPPADDTEGVAFDAARIEANDTVAGFVAREVRRDGDRGRVVFMALESGQAMQLAGTYTLKDGRKCVTLAESSSKVLPRTGDLLPEQLCLTIPGALTSSFEGLKRSDPLTVWVNGFTLEWDGKESRYTDARVTNRVR